MTAASGAGLADVLGPGWAEALAPVHDRIRAMGDFLRAEQAAGRRFLPRGERVFAAFQQPFDAVRVLLVGQDPYPTPGHAIGLCFSVAADVRPLPASLRNVFTEYRADLGLPEPTTGDLSPWVGQGVLLLNRCLTVAPGAPGSHRGKGWEHVTDAAIDALVARGGPLVAILWGRDARSLARRLGTVPRIESAHPSPLSARAGFFGSRPFSRANALLEEQGAPPVDWRLP
ncbi:uracil-DNA glycosylase [Egicoccus sp. AB-alg6-2]|uniref:uracil-DNA glycosylase n=1 Tax=Egicoccus sp. AB-alg6-2 TaxID=3242692 RepID=UPI00359ED7DA